MYTKRILFLLLFAWVVLAQGIRAQSPCTFNVQINPPSGVLSCQNSSILATATVLNPSGGLLEYQWYGPVGGIATDPSITITTPGYYGVYVWDSLNNCWGGDTILVTQDGTVPLVNIAVSGGATCDIQNDPVTLTAGHGGSIGTYTYEWSTGETTQQIDVTSPGTYCVTATNTDNCSAATCYTLVLPNPLNATISYYGGLFSCGDSSVMCANAQGGVAPYAYNWSSGNTYSCEFDPAPGTYVVTVTDAWGCVDVTSYVIEEDPYECAQLSGNVLADWNTNCLADGGDTGFSGVVIKVENGAGDEVFAYSGNTGAYSIELFPGTYTLTLTSPNNLWDPCPNQVTVTLGPNQALTQDLLLQPLAICPAMTVDITNTFLRRCFSGTYWVNYCNEGTATANNSYIDLTLDPLLNITSAAIPYTSQGNNVYRFDLGNVPINTCGSFSVTVHVSCNATLGQTHCTEAIIYPTGSCEPTNAQWSGASLHVQADCESDSLTFAIQNIGSGAMTEPLSYVIIEDAVMIMQAPPPSITLGAGDTHFVKVPANGATWRVEVDQAPFHPGNSMPSLSVEGCTTNSSFSVGYVAQFATNDSDPWIDIDCTPNVGSYDPNDKQGSPAGYEAAHYIDPGTDIEYTIQFQNTGTDTAFTVVIRDVLSPWLDPSRIRPGASSHPYTFEFYEDRNIKFVFEDINLPDSSKNFAGSQGYVTFRIPQQANVPLGTDIFNTAAIFFDFNEPVYTNTTKHRVDKNFVVVGAWQPFRPGLGLRLMPNPVETSAILQLEGLDAAAEWQTTLTDAMGRPVRQATINSGNQWQFERQDLPSGVYFLEVRSGGEVLGTGKVMLK